MLDAADAGGVRVERVEAGSIAQAAGLRSGDVLITVAGSAVKSVAELRRIIARQAPGTWLPIVVRRDTGESELIAKFPTE
jgi:S1-C subfamily serine protease